MEGRHIPQPRVMRERRAASERHHHPFRPCERRGKAWNYAELPGKSWNRLETRGKAWNCARASRKVWNRVEQRDSARSGA